MTQIHQGFCTLNSVQVCTCQYKMFRGIIVMGHVQLDLCYTYTCMYDRENKAYSRGPWGNEFAIDNTGYTRCKCKISLLLSKISTVVISHRCMNYAALLCHHIGIAKIMSLTTPLIRDSDRDSAELCKTNKLLRMLRLCMIDGLSGRHDDGWISRIGLDADELAEQTDTPDNVSVTVCEVEVMAWAEASV